MTTPTTQPANPPTSPPGFDWSSIGGRKFSGGIALGMMTLLVDRLTAEGINPQTMWVLVALYAIFVLGDAANTYSQAMSPAKALTSPQAPAESAAGATAPPAPATPTAPPLASLSEAGPPRAGSDN